MYHSHGLMFHPQISTAKPHQLPQSGKTLLTDARLNHFEKYDSVFSEFKFIHQISGSFRLFSMLLSPYSYLYL